MVLSAVQLIYEVNLMNLIQTKILFNNLKIFISPTPPRFSFFTTHAILRSILEKSKLSDFCKNYFLSMKLCLDKYEIGFLK